MRQSGGSNLLRQETDSSDTTALIRSQLWEKMRNKPYRDSFVEANLSTNIAAQIQTMREARGWTQKQLGEKAGMAQNRISVLEDPSYDKHTFATCRRIASAFDVAFIGRFVAFSDLAVWTSDLSPEKLTVADFEHDALPAPQPSNLSYTADNALMIGLRAAESLMARGLVGVTLAAPYGVSVDSTMGTLLTKGSGGNLVGQAQLMNLQNALGIDPLALQLRGIAA
jgi:transcriptional regulator with XRE-family HTH domain